MKKKTILLALAGAGLIAATPASFASDADRIAVLEKQLKVLQEQIEQLKASTAKSQDVVELRNQVEAQGKESVVAGDIPNSIRTPGSETSIHLYGIGELNFVHDTRGANADNDYATFAPYMPLRNSNESSRTGQTTLHARTSRIGVEATTPSSFGLITGKLEGDFNNDPRKGGSAASIATQQATNSYNFRLRHAYVQAGSWLAGQTWSTFMDLDAAPETVDFNGPTGTTMIRQPQIRYTYRTPQTGNFSVALENNDAYVLDGTTGSTSEKGLSKLPDLVLRWDKPFDWGSLSIRAVTQELRLKDQATTASARGWGLAASGTVKAFGDDLLSWNLTGGTGIGRYFNYVEGAGFDVTNNRIVMEKTLGFLVGYQHKFGDAYRANIAYGIQRSFTNNFTNWARISGLDSGRWGQNRQVSQIHLGGFWNPTKVLEVGAEYIYGQRKTLAGEKGDLSRINFLTRYYFN